MAIVKSNLIKQLADNYPNFIRKDLTKLIDIILKEMEKALLSNERVELREIFTLEPRIQKARISRNPKTFPAFEKEVSAKGAESRRS